LGVADRTKQVLHKENPDTRAILQNQLLEMQHDPTRKRKTKGKQNKQTNKKKTAKITEIWALLQGSTYLPGEQTDLPGCLVLSSLSEAVCQDKREDRAEHHAGSCSLCSDPYGIIQQGCSPAGLRGSPGNAALSR